MAGFNIRDFAAYMHTNGLMRNNKFLVRIPYPTGFDNSSILQNTSRYVELACDSTALPGIGVKTADVRTQGYGPIEKMGVTAMFQNVQMTFISDNKAAFHAFFYNWIKLITNPDARAGFVTSTGLPTLAGTAHRPYELSYKNEYISDVEVIVFNDAGEEVMKVVLRSAYPTSVGDIQMNWNDTGDYVRIPVSFTFTDYYVEYYK